MFDSGIMSRRACFLLILISLSCCFGAQAQTACPNGVAPGSPQCGPDSGTSRADSPPPQPTGKWIKTWGALAKNASGDMGFASGKISKSDAQAEAAERCESFESGECKVFEIFYNECISTAVSASGHAGIGVAGSKEQASTLAIKECEGGFGGVCKITLAECSRPVFQNF
ncbi:DUF4189 domain-containing protein [Xanthomonas fragariae]|uniref:DUF4189 domain-containing protein n=1 Tax=Xanthomonas fragariae TaxID=48664 RepID=UPI00106EF632|nr:DUF4189 domain-containing protein [Xanthomonas fragariae]